MPPITINVPTDKLNRVTDALAAAGGWTPDKGPKPQFAKQALIDHIVATVRNVEQSQAEQAAREQAVVTDLDGLS